MGAQDSLIWQDANRDGLIAPAEYANSVIRIYFSLDKNRDFQWSRDEFVVLNPRQPLFVTRERARLFHRYDTDGDASLSVAEVQSAITESFIARDRDKNLILTPDELPR